MSFSKPIAPHATKKQKLGKKNDLSFSTFENIFEQDDVDGDVDGDVDDVDFETYQEEEGDDDGDEYEYEEEGQQEEDDEEDDEEEEEKERREYKRKKKEDISPVATPPILSFSSLSSSSSSSSSGPSMTKAKTNPNNVFTCQTMKITNIGKLMTALKDILVETNMTIKPDGIRILNMDKSHTILVHLFLEAKNFDFYECKKDIIVIGLNMGQLYKLLQNVHQTDTLSIYIENCDYMDGIVSHLTLRSENAENNQCKTQKLKMIEPEFEELQYPNDVRFSSIITLPSNDFQRIIRDLSAISDKVEIRTVGNELTFKASGHFAQSEILRTEKENSMTFKEKQESSKIIQGEFSLKNLSYLTRCTNLCSEVEIYLENDLPLVVQYKVASLGSIKLCVSTLPSNI